MRRALVVHEKCGKPQFPILISKFKRCPCLRRAGYLDNRNWIIDTGASQHCVSSNALTPAEKGDLRPIDPIETNTANGQMTIDKAATVDVPHFGCLDCLVLDYDGGEESCMVSPGRLVDEGVCDFHWTRSQGAWMDFNDQTRLELGTAGYTPYIDPKGLGRKKYRDFFGLSKGIDKASTGTDQHDKGMPSLAAQSPKGTNEQGGADPRDSTAQLIASRGSSGTKPWLTPKTLLPRCPGGLSLRNQLRGSRRVTTRRSPLL